MKQSAGGIAYRFRHVVEQVEGKHVTLQEIGCSKCSATSGVRTSAGAADQTMVATRKFRSQGWEVGRDKNGDICPTCLRARKVRFPNVPEIRKVVEMIRAEPPRTATLADRKAIHDALVLQYDDGDQRYRKSASDKSVADELDMPVAWVVSVREFSFGMGAGNEMDTMRLAEIGQIRTEFDKLLEAFGALDGRLRKIEIDASYKQKAS